MRSETIQQKIDEVIRLARQETCARIDAGACRTERDYRNHRDAEKKFLDAYEDLMRELSRRGV